MERLLLINDTSMYYHFGCQGTSAVLKKKLRRMAEEFDTVHICELFAIREAPTSEKDFDSDAFRIRWEKQAWYLSRKLEAADIVVINGEGTLHHSSPQALRLWYIAYLAKTRFHKYTALVNASIYSDDIMSGRDKMTDRIIQKTASVLDYVAVREPYSYRECKRLELSGVARCFDCLPDYIRKDYKKQKETGEPYVLVTNGTETRRRDCETIAGVLNQSAAGLPVFYLYCEMPFLEDTAGLAVYQELRRLLDDKIGLMKVDSLDGWLDTIRNAKYLITGRFHFSIAAYMLNTPFLSFPGNTDKTKGALSEFNCMERLVTREDARSLATLSELLEDRTVRDEAVLWRIEELIQNNFRFSGIPDKDGEMRQEAVFWGASPKALPWLEHFNPVYFVDNDRNKWGQTFLGRMVLPPAHLIGDGHSRVKIVIVSEAGKESISLQLKRMGMEECIVNEVFFPAGSRYIHNN